MKDAEWIAQRLQCGLLKPSFVPDRQEWCGNATRSTTASRRCWRGANIKLGSVASDVLGMSGRKMIEALIAGEKDVTVLAELAQRKLRGKIL